MGSSRYARRQGNPATYDDQQPASHMLSPLPGIGTNAPPTAHTCSALPAYQPWSVPSLPSIPHIPRGRGPYTPLINLLPPEILALMFLHTTPTQLFDAMPDVRAMPIVLSHVCSYWRDVAVDLPHLWLWLSLSSCPTKHRHHYMELARAYMDRAKGMGMVIHYRDAEADTHSFRAFPSGQGVKCAPADERCFCALDLIVSRIAEIRVLELYIGHASVARLSSIPSSSVTSLRNLVIRFLEGGERTRLLSNLYMSSSTIRRVTWSTYFGVCTIPPPVCVPWTQLDAVHLYESPITITTFLDMLASGQNLTDVSVRLSPDARRLIPLQERIIQDALQTLMVYGEDYLDDAFNYIHLPSLRHLTLHSRMDQVHSWPFADELSLYHFVGGINPSLESFKLTPGGIMTENGFMNILSLPQMSRLKKLDFRLSRISDSFFMHMKPGPSIPILPHLEMLRVAKCATTDGVVGRMMRSRHKYCYPLRHLDMAFMRQEQGLHLQDAAEFRRLRMYGIYARDAY